MRKMLAPAITTFVLLAAAGAAQAQQGATFEARSLTPEAALKAALAAQAKCRAGGYQAAVAVVDRAGVPLVVLRDRFAGPHTVQTAVDKAYTAVTFKISTTELEVVTRPTGTMGGIRLLPRVVVIGGGLQVNAAGSQVGGIGVSGAPGGEADEVCAKAGVAAIGDDLEM